MDDLVERLRGTYSTGPFGKRDFEPFIPAIQKEAADEIERLREQCREALADNASLERHMNAREVYIAELTAALEHIASLEPLEINVSNYDHDDICQLNAAAVEAGLTADKALARWKGETGS